MKSFILSVAGAGLVACLPADAAASAAGSLRALGANASELDGSVFNTIFSALLNCETKAKVEGVQFNGAVQYMPTKDFVAEFVTKKVTPWDSFSRDLQQKVLDPSRRIPEDQNDYYQLQEHLSMFDGTLLGATGLCYSGNTRGAKKDATHNYAMISEIDVVTMVKENNLRVAKSFYIRSSVDNVGARLVEFGVPWGMGMKLANTTDKDYEGKKWNKETKQNEVEMITQLQKVASIQGLETIITKGNTYIRQFMWLVEDTFQATSKVHVTGCSAKPIRNSQPFGPDSVTFQDLSIFSKDGEYSIEEFLRVSTEQCRKTGTKTPVFWGAFSGVLTSDKKTGGHITFAKDNVHTAIELSLLKKNDDFYVQCESWITASNEIALAA